MVEERHVGFDTLLKDRCHRGFALFSLAKEPKQECFFTKSDLGGVDEINGAAR